MQSTSCVSHNISIMMCLVILPEHFPSSHTSHCCEHILDQTRDNCSCSLLSSSPHHDWLEDTLQQVVLAPDWWTPAVSHSDWSSHHPEDDQDLDLVSWHPPSPLMWLRHCRASGAEEYSWWQSSCRAQRPPQHRDSPPATGSWDVADLGDNTAHWCQECSSCECRVLADFYSAECQPMLKCCWHWKHQILIQIHWLQHINSSHDWTLILEYEWPTWVRELQHFSVSWSQKYQTTQRPSSWVS